MVSSYDKFDGTSMDNCQVMSVPIKLVISLSLLIDDPNYRQEQFYIIKEIKKCYRADIKARHMFFL